MWIFELGEIVLRQLLDRLDHALAGCGQPCQRLSSRQMRLRPHEVRRRRFYIADTRGGFVETGEHRFIRSRVGRHVSFRRVFERSRGELAVSLVSQSEMMKNVV